MGLSPDVLNYLSSRRMKLFNEDDPLGFRRGETPPPQQAQDSPAADKPDSYVMEPDWTQPEKPDAEEAAEGEQPGPDDEEKEAVQVTTFAKAPAQAPAAPPAPEPSQPEQPKSQVGGLDETLGAHLLKRLAAQESAREGVRQRNIVHRLFGGQLESDEPGIEPAVLQYLATKQKGQTALEQLQLKQADLERKKQADEVIAALKAAQEHLARVRAGNVEEDTSTKKIRNEFAPEREQTAIDLSKEKISASQATTELNKEKEVRQGRKTDAEINKMTHENALIDARARLINSKVEASRKADANRGDGRISFDNETTMFRPSPHRSADPKSAEADRRAFTKMASEADAALGSIDTLNEDLKKVVKNPSVDMAAQIAAPAGMVLQQLTKALGGGAMAAHEEELAKKTFGIDFTGGPERVQASINALVAGWTKDPKKMVEAYNQLSSRSREIRDMVKNMTIRRAPSLGFEVDPTWKKAAPASAPAAAPTGGAQTQAPAASTPAGGKMTIYVDGKPATLPSEIAQRLLARGTDAKGRKVSASQ